MLSDQILKPEETQWATVIARMTPEIGTLNMVTLHLFAA